MNPNLSVLVNEIKNRARIYVHIYRELSKEVGKEKGQLLASKIGKPDLHKLAVSLMKGQGDMDAFGHLIAQEESDHVVLRLNHCPLVEAWQEEGLSPEEQKILCDIAHQVDFGKFEGAGYRLVFDCRIADGKKSCDLRITV